MVVKWKRVRSCCWSSSSSLPENSASEGGGVCGLWGGSGLLLWRRSCSSHLLLYWLLLQGETPPILRSWSLSWWYKLCSSDHLSYWSKLITSLTSFKGKYLNSTLCGLHLIFSTSSPPHLLHLIFPSSSSNCWDAQILVHMQPRSLEVFSINFSLRGCRLSVWNDLSGFPAETK